jgi:hypothetical protein
MNEAYRSTSGALVINILGGHFDILSISSAIRVMLIISCVAAVCDRHVLQEGTYTSIQASYDGKGQSDTPMALCKRLAPIWNPF